MRVSSAKEYHKEGRHPVPGEDNRLHGENRRTAAAEVEKERCQSKPSLTCFLWDLGRCGRDSNTSETFEGSGCLGHDSARNKEWGSGGSPERKSRWKRPNPHHNADPAGILREKALDIMTSPWPG